MNANPIVPPVNAAPIELHVMMSGGFTQAFRALLPGFQRTTGIAVVTASAASQGTGSNTVKAQLESGARPDVVILSREGLSELIAAGRIEPGTDVSLARVPIGAAVRLGQPRPGLATIDDLKRALLNAGLIALPGSTSGIFLMKDVFPRLGIADKVSVKVSQRGAEAAAMAAAGEADIVLSPVSELLNAPGIAFVGRLPDEVQLLQVFAAAIVAGSDHLDDAKRLIEFLASSQAAAAIENSGMEPLGRGVKGQSASPTRPVPKQPQGKNP